MSCQCDIFVRRCVAVDLSRYRREVADVVGVAEIAKRLGKSDRTVRRWLNRPDFPPPIAHLAIGRVWEWHEIEAWAQRTLPLPIPGRPPKQTS
jgi:prophage regulatory protein